MELREFIETALVQIFEGVSNAQPKINELGGTINPFDFDYRDNGKLIYSEYSVKQFIDFEISLTKSESTANDKGLAVFFGSLSGGTKFKSESESTAFNRVKFSLPVFYPVNKSVKL